MEAAARFAPAFIILIAIALVALGDAVRVAAARGPRRGADSTAAGGAPRGGLEGVLLPSAPSPMVDGLVISLVVHAGPGGCDRR